MTDASGAKPKEDEGVVIDLESMDPFAALMDALAPDVDAEPAAKDGSAAPAAPTGDGSPAAPAQGAPAATGKPDAPAEGAAGGGAVPPADGAKPADADAGAGAAGAETAPVAGDGDIDPVTLEPEWSGQLAALETRQIEELTSQAVADIRVEFKGYLDRIEAPARSLVGTKVPSLSNPDVEETLKDSQDAADWQNAVREELAKEVRQRVSRGQDESQQMMAVLTGSINLFQQNHDIIPGTKGFDKELAEKFVELVEPYELRVEDKLVGYNIDVQPFLTKLRAQLVAARAAVKPDEKAPEPTAQQQRAASQERTPEGQFTQPQAGIQSKAGGGGDNKEDFSTLFGTIGLPDFQI